MKKIKVSKIFHKRIKDINIKGEILGMKHRELKLKSDQFWYDFNKKYGINNYKWDKKKDEFSVMDEEEDALLDKPFKGFLEQPKEEKKNE